MTRGGGGGEGGGEKEKLDPRFKNQLKAVALNFEALGWDLGTLQDSGENSEERKGPGAGGRAGAGEEGGSFLSPRPSRAGLPSLLRPRSRSASQPRGSKPYRHFGGVRIRAREAGLR